MVDVWEQDDTVHIVMTHLRGRRLREVMHRLSYPECNRLADELGSHVEQLRKIPNNSAFLFCNTLGARIVDHRMPDRSGGPFSPESEFNNHLSSHLKCSPAEVVGKENLREDHRSYFKHCDLHCTNLLVHRGRLSGIVDWECAGYMPEYWEYTKAMYGSLRNSILDSIFRRAFGGRYEAELDVERKFWRYTPFGV